MRIGIQIGKIPHGLSGHFIQPEIDAALETIGKRLERPGKGLGERRNKMWRERVAQGQRITFVTHHHPRYTGFSKLRKMTGIFRSMAPNVIRKMGQRMQERWAR